MNARDWYPDWRHHAVHELEKKTAHLRAEYQLGKWPRFDYDIDAGSLVFSEAGRPRVVGEVQIVGTTSVLSGDWLWSWANSHWPVERTTDAMLVRSYGLEHGIDELTRDRLQSDDLNALGWELAAVMVHLTDAVGAYRPKGENGALFLTIKTLAWVA